MLLEGKKYEDERGIITYNNDFDASSVKRMYTIQHHSTDFIRGWQGHRIEQRWFACMEGIFEISVMVLDDFVNPSKNLPIQRYLLTDDELTYLHVPRGCITAIQAKENNSKLIAFSDYKLGDIDDEYRYSLDFFK